MLLSDVPRAAIIGATSLVIHSATVSAMAHRSVAAGEKTTRRLSGRSTASSLMTSAAMHSPGPAIGGNGLKDRKVCQLRLTRTRSGCLGGRDRLSLNALGSRTRQGNSFRRCHRT